MICRRTVFYNCLLIAFLLAAFSLNARTETFIAAGKEWRIETVAAAASKPGFGIRAVFTSTPTTPAFEQPEPLAVEIVDSEGKASWLHAPYRAIERIPNGFRAVGEIVTPAGSRFAFTDTYLVQPDQNSVQMERQAEVQSASAPDSAFSTRFGLRTAAKLAAMDCDFLAPGVWYKQNEHAPPAALAKHLEDHHILIREDRMGLPLLMVRQRNSGVTLSLQRLNSSPSTILGDDGLNRISNEGFQYGSLGVENAGALETLFQFPGAEGERTYVFGAKDQAGRWALRSHPVRAGFVQRYSLLLRLSRTSDYAAALRDTWRSAYAVARPQISQVDLSTAYRAEIDLMAELCRPYNGVVSIPFGVRVPSGDPHDISCQMGFVGDALPAAALLLRPGSKQSATLVALQPSSAEKLIDFWVKESRTSSGVLRTWYDIKPNGDVAWRSYPMFLRVACDGVQGVLRAWSVMKARSADRPKWLDYCSQFGDWLIAHQQPDGSWRRSFPLDGSSGDASTDTTIQAIPFLIDLCRATGDSRYLACSLKAGAFCWQHVHREYAYVGGTPDNPNTTDKEASCLAVDGFLALHDATRDAKWLDAAQQAAWNAETWTYLQNIRIPDGDPKTIYPRKSTTVGLSLIALGHSGADNYMARIPFAWYRLYLLTGEKHFLEFARLMLRNGRQMMDVNGDLGYRHRGLLTEALTLAPLRGHGVTDWLPWLGVTILEPMAQLEDTFGSMDIDQIDKLPHSERKRLNARFAETRGVKPSNP